MPGSLSFKKKPEKAEEMICGKEDGERKKTEKEESERMRERKQ